MRKSVNIPAECALHCSAEMRRKCEKKDCAVYAGWFKAKWNDVTGALRQYDLSKVEIIAK